MDHKLCYYNENTARRLTFACNWLDHSMRVLKVETSHESCNRTLASDKIKETTSVQRMNSGM